MKIQAPEILKAEQPDCIVICSSAYREISAQIADLGVSCEYFYIYELFTSSEDRLSQLEMLQIDILATKNDPFPILLLKKPQILVNISYRLARFFKDKPIFFPLYVLFFVFHYFVCWVTSVQLPLETEIGPGFIIAHPGTIVVTGRADRLICDALSLLHYWYDHKRRVSRYRGLRNNIRWLACTRRLSAGPTCAGRRYVARS